MAKTVMQKNTEFLRVPGVRDIIPCALMFIGARAQLMGTFPFGLALFCACFDKSAAYLGITALYLGLLSAGAGAGAVKYMLGAMIFWLFIKLCSRAGKNLCAAVCGCALLVSGLAMTFYGTASMYDVLLLIAEAAVCAVMYIVFTNASALLSRSRRAPSQEELVSLAIAAAVIITGTSGISLPYGIEPAHIAAVLAVMAVAKNTSISASAAMGLCIGFITGAQQGSAIVMTGVFGICAAFANLLKDFGRFGVAAGFIGGGAVALLCLAQSETLMLNIWEVGIASAIFVLIPGRVHKKLGAYFEPAVSDDVNIARVKEYLSSRLEECAAAFSGLKEAFVSGTEERADRCDIMVGEMFDKVADRVCRSCGRAQRCWDMDFDKTCKGMVSLLGVIESEGVLCRENTPLQFHDRCVRSGEFISEFNHVYELEKAQLLRLGDAKRSRDLAAVQYGEISRIFKNFAKDIEEGFDFCTDAEERIISGLDAAGIIVFEVNAAQSKAGKYEIFLRLGAGYSIPVVEKVVSGVIGCEAAVVRDSSRGEVMLVSKPRFCVETGMAKRSVQAQSGDSFCTFSDGDHRFWAIISDGMGSGEAAMEESGMSVRLLREFLLAGFGAKTAINMLNSSLCLKLERESFATIDLLQIDLMTGVAEFYKIGAAGSIIYRNGETQSVYSMSPPAGMIEEVEAAGQPKRVEDGDIILMMSDGVTDAPLVRTEWIKKRIKTDCDSMDKLAAGIIDTAIEKGGGEIKDDMSVIGIKITEC
ncbi:MAG: SpoIIE family protein phosphatase [Clostridiales bacterium]|nr:SpoIIE family protein phosphatase [Clostridiales bacterium]